MKRAIAKHSRDFAAVVALFLAGLLVGGYILSQQRLYLPAWVPVMGKDFVDYKAELSTAQAVTPGQGQTVNIAGVKVGEIGSVDLRNGRGIVTLKIERKYAALYRDAEALLRPKTGLKDMFVELDPGLSTAGELREGATIPIANTLPDVNLDEVLAAVDSDTRHYLQALAVAAGEGLGGQGRALSAALRRFEPTSRDVAEVTRLLAERRSNLRRVSHNFSQLVSAVGAKDRDLARLVDSSNTVLRVFAEQEASLRETVELLPGTLDETQKALGKTDTLARTLGPTLQALRPGARALGPALRATRPFLRSTLPTIRDELRPFAREARPVIRQLRPAARDLADLTPELTKVAKVVNYLLNELAHNPPGDEEGFLFYLSWANHAGAQVFSTQDAHGPIRRGLILFSCSTLGLLDQLAALNPVLGTIVGLTNAPLAGDVCPAQAGATGTTVPPAKKAGR